MLSRLVLSSTPMLSMSLARHSIQKVPLRNQVIRQFNRDARDTYTRSERIAERKSLRERIMAPAGPNGKTAFKGNQSNGDEIFRSCISAYGIGKGALAAGSALGIGALCFYGLGLSSDKSTIMNNSM